MRFVGILRSRLRLSSSGDAILGAASGIAVIMAMSCHTADLPDDSFGLLLMGSEFTKASMEWLFIFC
jgi:hypothetical protein